MYVSLEGLRATFKISKDKWTTQSCHLVFDLITESSQRLSQQLCFCVHECFSFQDFSFLRFHKKSSWIQNNSLVFHSSDFTELIKYEEFSGKGNGGVTWRQ